MLDKKERILAWVIIIAGAALVIYAYAVKGGLFNPDTFFGAAGSIYGIFLLIKNKSR